MRQTVVDATFRCLANHADELDNGDDPFKIIKDYCGIPRETAQKIFEELWGQDKIGLLRDGDEIIAAFINRGLEGAPRKKSFAAHCVVFLDTENFRMLRGLPRHVFSGEINDQLKQTGFVVRDAFAFLNGKGATPHEVLNQASALARHGFIPVFCPETGEEKEKDPSPDDTMLERVARIFYGHQDVESFVVISGDKRFHALKNEVNKQGHEFYVFAGTSNINEQYRKQVNAFIIELSGDEKIAYDFLDKWLKSLTGGSAVPEAKNDTEDLAVLFVDEAIDAIKRFRNPGDFNTFVNFIWARMPEWHQKFTIELLSRVIHIIGTYTDIIESRPYYFGRRQAGRNFKYNQNSQSARLFQRKGKAS